MQIKELKESSFNPRKISQEELEVLKESLLILGDLSGVIYNQTTGNLAGGNQRIKVFKELNPDLEIIVEEKLEAPNKQGTIARGYFIHNGEKYSYREVVWSEEQEKLANLAANNIQGVWDIDKLGAVLNDLKDKGLNIIEIAKAGFKEKLLQDYFEKRQSLDNLISIDFIDKMKKIEILEPEMVLNDDEILPLQPFERELDEDIPTNLKCPKCGYEFN
jgi:hypothetical protein